MPVLEFAVLATLDLSLIVLILRKWGLASAEGLCMAYAFMAVVTDHLELLFDYLARPGNLILGVHEFEFRVYPTVVHIIGLLALTAGLLVFSSRPRSVALEMSEAGTALLRRTGIAIVVVGLVFLGVACYLAGAYPGPNFFQALDVFRTKAVSFGGFWYRGPDIMTFGLALVMASVKTRSRRARASLLGILLLMMLVSFFARTNKGGFEVAVLWSAMVLYIYNRKGLKLLFKPAAMAVLGAVIFLGIGVKNVMLSPSANRPTSAGIVLRSSLETIAARWGDNSTYRGYCQFINGLPAYHHYFDDYKVGRYALTSFVPRVLQPDKADHPFRGLGFMIYSDYHTYPMETPAVEIVGSAFADSGFLSLILYLFATGTFLGIFRGLAATPKSSLHWHVAYVMFTLFGGLSAEAGIISIVYVLILTSSVVGTAHLLARGTELGRRVRTNILSHASHPSHRSGVHWGVEGTES
ncbi:MAG TPA: hypothetical protein VG204_23015 [Terriglobia bacterium]|nr:hypothetical protein [Terriglobia bacterium]